MAKLHSKLKLDIVKQNAERMAIEQGIDKMVKKGVIPGLLTDKMKKKEISRNNK